LGGKIRGSKMGNQGRTPKGMLLGGVLNRRKKVRATAPQEVGDPEEERKNPEGSLWTLAQQNLVVVGRG